MSQDKAWQRLNGDPMGLGTMRRDKVTELAYTGEDAPEDVQNGALHSCRPAEGRPDASPSVTWHRDRL